jgi:hypothetical protein
MNELAALKLVGDLAVAAIEQMITVQKINQLLHTLKSENRVMTDADWAAINADTKAAEDKLRVARANAGFVRGELP